MKNNDYKKGSFFVLVDRVIFFFIFVPNGFSIS